MSWQLAEAKNRFSEVVRKALAEGPQKVSRRNEHLYLISEKDYLKLHSTAPDFRQFLLGINPDGSERQLLPSSPLKRKTAVVS